MPKHNQKQPQIKQPRAKQQLKANQIKALFLQHYHNAKTELIYHNIYELLVCVILSAQCTDKRVNIVTPALFAKYKSPKELAKADINDVKELIKSVSFFNNKAHNLIKMAQQVVNDFGGEIPTNRDELKTLAGVGQKTANVVLIEYFEANFMAVDTHVFRVSHRLGLSVAKSALETEKDLSALFKDNLSVLHQGFVLFGRYVCKAIKPQCQECFVKDFCITRSNFKPA
ncbi:endonuclease III [Helicobacter fennelliae]|uniref:Endonuclease III n=1 Tax=Helicobacter fennelliae TaxID=215 RepID=A0A2X3B189_9HELI|nr:endonuclease III [Helicobacter fennelliae]SQB98978.1 endonuclease III [Helicobacter fennelliae]STQ84670.1 endonuclease III [Helicobacter fennelliae]